METATVYESRNNLFTITLKKNDVTLTSTDMEAITKFEIKYDGTYYNSVDDSTGFSRDNANGQITIKPFELSLATGHDKAELIVYDAGDNSDGLVWAQFGLTIKNDAVPAS